MSTKEIRLRLYFFLFLVATGFFFYASALDNQTHFDDSHNVNTPAVNYLFPLSHFFVYNPETEVTLPQRGLALLTHGITRVFSAEDNYFWFYLLNISLHILNAFLVFLVVKALLRFFREPESIPLSFFCSLIFLLHPIHLYVAAYLTQRTSLMMFGFSMISLLFFLRWLTDEKRRMFSFLFSLLFFMLALYSKENAVTFLAIFAILHYFQKRRLTQSDNTERGGEFGYLMAFLLLFLVYIYTGYFSAQMELVSDPTLNYLFSQFVVLLQYLRIFLLPLPSFLNVDWDIPFYASFFEFPVFWSFLVLAAFFSLGVCSLWKEKHPLAGFCILWYFITVSPDSSFVALPEKMVEYRLYLPSFGLILLFGYALHRAELRLGRLGVLSVLLWIFPVVGCAFLQTERLPTFDTKVSFWTDAVEKSPNKVTGYFFRGMAFVDEGNYERAIRDFNRGIALKPDSRIFFHERAMAFERLGKTEEAIRDYRASIQREPLNPFAYFNLGIIYQNEGNTKDALECYDSAIQLKPREASFYLNRGELLFRLGNHEAALRDYEKGSGLAPKEVRFYLNRSIVLKAMGRETEASSAYQRGVELYQERR